MLGPGTKVGAGGNLLRSVVLTGATVAPGATVADQVIGPGAELSCR